MTLAAGGVAGLSLAAGAVALNLGVLSANVHHRGWPDLGRALQPDTVATLLADHTDLDPADQRNADIIRLQAALRNGDVRPQVLERLGWAFIGKARAADEPSFYELALHSARALEERFGNTPAAALIRGHALHSLHRFKEAEAIAHDLVTRRGSPLDYALLGDALFDQGKVHDATRAYRKLMRLRPDSVAYARVAEARRMTGDLEGALGAMRVAARAVSRRDAESYAWIWSRLGAFELEAGRFPEARAAAGVALDRKPDFPAALLVVGRAYAAEGLPELALAPLEKATRRVRLVEPLRLLAELYRMTGNAAKAAATESLILRSGVLADPRGLAAYLAETKRDPERALKLARTEREIRADVATYDTLAVAWLAMGNLERAAQEIHRALSIGTRDARLFYHAGLISAAEGDGERARSWFLKACAIAHTLFPSERAALDCPALEPALQPDSEAQHRVRSDTRMRFES